MSSVKKRNSIAVVKLFKDGLNTKQIVKKTGLSLGTVQRHIRESGLRKNKTLEDKETRQQEVKSLLDSGLKVKEMCKLIDRSNTYIYKIMNELGMREKSIRQLCREHGVSADSVNSLRNRKGLSVMEAIEMAKVTNKIKWSYGDFKGLPEIAKGLGLSYSSLAHVVYDLGVKDIEDAIEIVKRKQRKPVTNKPVINPSWKLALGIRA